MFTILRQRHGQTSIAQYAVIFFLGVGAIVAMSTFVQRTLQARIRDTRNFMISETSIAHGNQIQYEYEPYYGNVQTNTDRTDMSTTQLLQGGGTGIFRKTINQKAVANTVSEQAPPREAQ